MAKVETPRDLKSVVSAPEVGVDQFPSAEGAKLACVGRETEMIVQSAFDRQGLPWRSNNSACIRTICEGGVSLQQLR